MASEVQIKDVAGVRSRVSWGAILGGVMTSIAVFFLLSVLGTAIGATVLYRTGDERLIEGAAIWATITMVIALFCGGCVASQCTAGETKEESLIYGVILWGAMFTMLMWLMASRVNIGFVDVMSATHAAQSGTGPVVSLKEKDLRDQKFSDEQIAYLQKQNPNLVAGADPQQRITSAAQDPRTVSAAWWTFGGILLSMLAAISGAFTGAGPNLRLVGFGWRSVLASRQHTGSPRTAV